jgi:hypothetical protein
MAIYGHQMKTVTMRMMARSHAMDDDAFIFSVLDSLQANHREGELSNIMDIINDCLNDVSLLNENDSSQYET